MLKIHAFDPASIKPNRKLLWIGGSGRGKTQHMLYTLSYVAPSIDMYLLFCPTETTCNLFRRRGMIPASFIYSNIDLKVIEKALSTQREMRERGKKRSLLLIFDDVAFDKSAWRSDVIRDLLYNQRHIGITTALSVQ